MKQKPAYIFFHLNLLFSSLKKSDFRKVINRCYWGIKILISNGIKISLEANAKSLEIIDELDKEFIKFLKEEINKSNIEFVASGYVQMISPLSSYEITKLNIDISLKIYKQLLNIKPKIFLINEMAFSSSILNTLGQYDFEGIIMDIDNLALATGHSKENLFSKRFIKNKHSKALKIFWSDSRLFQSFQRYIHGDINLENYFSRLDEHLLINKASVPIYTNDLEVFNYRPGRFKEEDEIKDDEWQKIMDLISHLVERNHIFNLISDLPTHIMSRPNKRNTLQFSPSIAHAVCVKKQPKYNIARWAVTGRMDQKLNTFCGQIEKNISLKSLSFTESKELLYFWGSDLRTHLSNPRFKELKKKIKNYRIKKKIHIKNTSKLHNDWINLDSNNKLEQENFKYAGDFLIFSNDNLNLELCLHKGLAINNLSYGSKKPFISSFNNQYFDDITHGVDYFSGTSLIEIPSEKKRYTDLKRVDKLNILKKDKSYKIVGNIDLGINKLKKVITIDSKDQIKFEYFFSKSISFDGVIRLGNLIFNREFCKSISLESNLGGNITESFLLNTNSDHSKRISMIVSSSSGFPASKGVINIKSNNNVKIILDHASSFSLPMIVNEKINSKWFSRLLFSLSEVDDNSCIKDMPKYFSFAIQKN